jgi:hypothetical protein
MNLAVPVYDTTKINGRFDYKIYPEKYEYFIRPAYRSRKTLAQPPVQKTAMKMKRIEAVLNG